MFLVCLLMVVVVNIVLFANPSSTLSALYVLNKQNDCRHFITANSLDHSPGRARQSEQNKFYSH